MNIVRRIINWFKRDTEWQFHVPIFGPKTSLQMRRRVNGEWQFRPATPEEELDFMKSDAW